MTRKFFIIIALFLVTLTGCKKDLAHKVIFRVDGGWYMPPAFHGNPYAPGGDGTHMHFLWEKLFLMIPQTNEYIPRLGLNYSISPDRLKLIVKLRKNVLWHDLTPFTAKDIKSTMLIKYAMGWGGKLHSIVTPDDYTVIFKMRKPLGAIDEKIIFNQRIMAPYHLYKSFADRAEEILLKDRSNPPINDYSKLTKAEQDRLALIHLEKSKVMQDIYKFRPQIPIGTGPFKFLFVTAADLGLQKFQRGYEAHNINIDEVRILKSITNDIMWAYLVAGEIDAAHPATPQDVTEQVLKLNPQTKLILPSDYGEFGFIFNTTKKPMSDLNFRRAVAYAINKDLIRMISYYYSTTVGPYNTGVLHSLKDKWLDPSIYRKMTAYHYNLDLAHKILQDAGYKKDDYGFYLDLDGKPIQIEVASIAGYSDWVLGCESMSNQLTKLGIRSKIKTYEPSLYHQLLATKQYDIASNFGTDYKNFAHPSPSYNRYYAKGAYIKQASGIPDEFVSYDGKKIVLKKALETLANNRKKKKSKEIIKHLAWYANEHLPFLTVYEKNLMVFVVDGKRITGWPKANDPIWSASSSGLESIFSYLISTGKVRAIRK